MFSAAPSITEVSKQKPNLDLFQCVVENQLRNPDFGPFFFFDDIFSRPVCLEVHKSQSPVVPVSGHGVVIVPNR